MSFVTGDKVQYIGKDSVKYFKAKTDVGKEGSVLCGPYQLSTVSGHWFVEVEWLSGEPQRYNPILHGHYGHVVNVNNLRKI